MTTREILEMSFDDLNKLKFNDLKKLTKILSKTANTRIRTIVDRYEKTPAIEGMIESGGRFGVSGIKSLNKMRKEFARVRNFLQDQTSLVRGVELWKDNSIEQLAKQKGINISRNDFDLIYKKLSDLKKFDNKYGENLMKYTYLRMAENNFEKYANMTTEELAREIDFYYAENEHSHNRLFDLD